MKYVITELIDGISAVLLRYIDKRLNSRLKFKDKKLLYFFIVFSILFFIMFTLMQIRDIFVLRN